MMNRTCFATALLLTGLILPAAAQTPDSFQTVLLTDPALSFNLLGAYDNPPLPGHLGVRFKPLTTSAEAHALIQQLGYVLLDTLAVRTPTANPVPKRSLIGSDRPASTWQKLGYLFKIYVGDEEMEARRRLLLSPLVQDVTLVFPNYLMAPWR